METVNQEEQATKEVEVKTFTENEVNDIVKERLARERKKYEGIDLEALKSKAAKFDEMEAANKSELEKANDKVQALEAELNGIKKANELNTMREAVAKEIGIPANLLTGTTEDECREQAEAIKEFASPSGYPAVKDGGEPQALTKKNAYADFSEWANKVFV